MSDLIDRQAAIDALHMHLMYRMGTDSNKKRLDDWINSLPSAQETHDKRTETHACDLISRAAVVDAIEGVDWYHQNQHGEMVHGANPDEHQAWYKADDIYKAIERVLSAQPERIKGHWVEIASSNHTYKCSVCGRLLVNITDGKNNVAKNYPYCHCGADMRGEQDG